MGVFPVLIHFIFLDFPWHSATRLRPRYTDSYGEVTSVGEKRHLAPCRKRTLHSEWGSRLGANEHTISHIYIYIHIYIYTRYTYCRNSLRPQLGSWVVIKMIPGSCTFPGAAQAPQMMGSYPRKPDFVSKIFWSKKRMGPPVELAFSCLEKAAEFYGLL